MRLYNIEFDGVDHRDAPDYCDAFISYAEHEDGVALTAEELDDLNSNHSYVVYGYLLNRLY